MTRVVYGSFAGAAFLLWCCAYIFGELWCTLEAFADDASFHFISIHFSPFIQRKSNNLFFLGNGWIYSHLRLTICLSPSHYPFNLIVFSNMNTCIQ